MWRHVPQSAGEKGEVGLKYKHFAMEKKQIKKKIYDILFLNRKAR